MQNSHEDWYCTDTGVEDFAAMALSVSPPKNTKPFTWSSHQSHTFVKAAAMAKNTAWHCSSMRLNLHMTVLTIQGIITLVHSQILK